MRNHVRENGGDDDRSVGDGDERWRSAEENVTTFAEDISSRPIPLNPSPPENYNINHSSSRPPETSPPPNRMPTSTSSSFPNQSIFRSIVTVANKLRPKVNKDIVSNEEIQNGSVPNGHNVPMYRKYPTERNKGRRLSASHHELSSDRRPRGMLYHQVDLEFEEGEDALCGDDQDDDESYSTAFPLFSSTSQLSSLRRGVNMFGRASHRRSYHHLPESSPGHEQFVGAGVGTDDRGIGTRNNQSSRLNGESDSEFNLGHNGNLSRRETTSNNFLHHSNPPGVGSLNIQTKGEISSENLSNERPQQIPIGSSLSNHQQHHHTRYPNYIHASSNGSNTVANSVGVVGNNSNGNVQSYLSDPLRNNQFNLYNNTTNRDECVGPTYINERISNGRTYSNNLTGYDHHIRANSSDGSKGGYHSRSSLDVYDTPSSELRSSRRRLSSQNELSNIQPVPQYNTILMISDDTPLPSPRRPSLPSTEPSPSVIGRSVNDGSEGDNQSTNDSSTSAFLLWSHIKRFLLPSPSTPLHDTSELLPPPPPTIPSMAVDGPLPQSSRRGYQSVTTSSVGENSAPQSPVPSAASESVELSPLPTPTPTPSVAARFMTSSRSSISSLLTSLRTGVTSLASRFRASNETLPTTSTPPETTEPRSSEGRTPDDPTCQQLLCLSGVCLGPFLFVMGALLLLVTPRENKRSRAWGYINLVMAGVWIASIVYYYYNTSPSLLTEHIQLYTSSQHYPSNKLWQNSLLSISGVIKILRDGHWTKVKSVSWDFEPTDLPLSWTPATPNNPTKQGREDSSGALFNKHLLTAQLPSGLGVNESKLAGRELLVYKSPKSQNGTFGDAEMRKMSEGLKDEIKKNYKRVSYTSKDIPANLTGRLGGMGYFKQFSGTIEPTGWVLGPSSKDLGNLMLPTKETFKLHEGVMWSDLFRASGRLKIEAIFSWGGVPSPLPLGLKEDATNISIAVGHEEVDFLSLNQPIVQQRQKLFIGDMNLPYNYLGSGVRCVPVPKKQKPFRHLTQVNKNRQLALMDLEGSSSRDVGDGKYSSNFGTLSAVWALTSRSTPGFDKEKVEQIIKLPSAINVSQNPYFNITGTNPSIPEKRKRSLANLIQEEMSQSDHLPLSPDVLPSSFVAVTWHCRGVLVDTMVDDNRGTETPRSATTSSIGRTDHVGTAEVGTRTLGTRSNGKEYINFITMKSISVKALP